MDVNFWIIISLLLRFATVALLAVGVIPKQIAEMKDPRNTGRYGTIAKLLFSMVMIFITVSIVPFAYQTTRLESDPGFTLQNFASLATNVGNFAFAVGWYLLYNRKFNNEEK